MIDLWQSRRDTFSRVQYWSQINNEDLVQNYSLVYEFNPTGEFMAKEVSSINMESQVVGESAMYDQETVNIYTRDKIDDLRVNDLVKYNNKMYRVDSIQKNPVKRQRQFMGSKVSAEYYISLRG